MRPANPTTSHRIAARRFSPRRLRRPEVAADAAADDNRRQRRRGRPTRPPHRRPHARDQPGAGDAMGEVGAPARRDTLEPRGSGGRSCGPGRGRLFPRAEVEAFRRGRAADPGDTTRAGRRAAAVRCLGDLARLSASVRQLGDEARRKVSPHGGKWPTTQFRTVSPSRYTCVLRYFHTRTTIAASQKPAQTKGPSGPPKKLRPKPLAP